jgi:hypothetical protein
MRKDTPSAGPAIIADPTYPAEDRHRDAYHLDGNALGGLLADIFGRDVTGGEARCGACGMHGPVGGLMAYNRSPGSVLSCPGCGAVLLVVVRRPDGYRVTFAHLRSLELGRRA